MRILMLTSVYKDESLGNKDTSTNIVNSFVKEWKKQGHEVLVIHNSHCYPRVIHEIPEKLKKSLAARMGFSISDYDAVKEKEYQDNGRSISDGDHYISGIVRACKKNGLDLFLIHSLAIVL